MGNTTDVIVVGSGVGGGPVARRLTENGVHVTLLERGDWVAREMENWSASAVFIHKRYTAHDKWLDAKGRAFHPNMYYNVGGCSKFYGAALVRFRERDFSEVEHLEGVSPAWPISYADLEPYYCEAEAVFGVHGNDYGDSSAPPRSRPLPVSRDSLRARSRCHGGRAADKWDIRFSASHWR